MEWAIWAILKKVAIFFIPVLIDYLQIYVIDVYS